ncbi:hypothetical protein [Arthrobacter sp. ISL-30]|uniref:hypothetical protein n=1 Tax=Arthrobacter sp. ISL-30 TaxID=2819109 RepID=UPI001BEC4FCD|nr:hypothetical protein [Arthrobacter sp. ISL-30]MBT2513011.1 hypothetical protein [Arthrobacter sp. ISL-30]
MTACTSRGDLKTATKVVPDWTTLFPGDFVTIIDDHNVPDSGWVDDMTDDGKVIWIILVRGRGRRMFLREENCTITVEVPQWNA